MNKYRLLPLAFLPLLLAGCTGALMPSDTGVEDRQLAACTGIGSMFENKPFDEWAKTYHATVSDVIEAHMDSLKDTATEQLQCTAPDYQGLVKPTSKLSNLAKTLPPWKDNAKLQALSEMDVGSVLLEYLRIYECSLAERRSNLAILIPEEHSSELSSDATVPMERGAYDKEMTTEQREINHELAIARPTLDRTLMIVGGEDRLRPLSEDIECLKRVSLDIRNIMGLISQASACLPRIRDARGSIRDLPDASTVPSAP